MQQNSAHPGPLDMYVILGGTGHIGSALAKLLIQRGNPVTVVTRDPQKRAEWESRGASVAVADIRDVQRLRGIFSASRRAYLLNPPAPPSTDTDHEERRTAESIAAALAGSGLERVVVQSTYGARPGRNIGDLGTLHAFEEAVLSQAVPTTILRAAYFMSNWDAVLDVARSTGTLLTFFPADFTLPMVAPEDIELLAADLLTREPMPPPLSHIEGPQPYSANDVAQALSTVFQTRVSVQTIPTHDWVNTLRSAGFSQPAAESMAAMTRIVLDQLDSPRSPHRGPTTVSEYFGRLGSSDAGPHIITS